MIYWRKFFTLSGVLCLITTASYAQSYVESALTFSRSIRGGSARIQAMGGSQIALGGDYSSALSNPAGLGFFNRSEFTLSPGLSLYETGAQYLGESVEDSRSTFNIPGLSLVFNMPINKGGFVGGSFAISLSRINDFNRSTTYHGINENTSIIDYFIDDAFGSTTDQFDGFQFNTPTGLAYYNYLIGPASLLDPDFPDDEYFTDVRGKPEQRENIETRGATNQWSFSYGANYKDMLFLGGSIGVSSLRYESSKVFTEDFLDDEFLNGLDLIENLNIRGTGINATLGAIVRPVDFLQVGVSFTSPTYYQLEETYNATLNSSWKDFIYYSNKPNYTGTENPRLNNESAFTDDLLSDYSLTTPSKFSAGMAFISKYGLITGDIEFMNPSRAKYSSNTEGISFGQENDGIRGSYKSVVNYRGGAEFRYKVFRARGGYGVQGNPYHGDYDSNITTISAGLGARFDKFYIDFAWVQSKGNNLYQPYTFFDGSGPVVELENKTTTGMLTLGFTF